MRVYLLPVAVARKFPPCRPISKNVVGENGEWHFCQNEIVRPKLTVGFEY